MGDGRFRLELEAAGSDIDDLGHVSNLVFVRWVLEAATAHSRAAGLDTADYFGIGGVFVVRRHEIEYLAPAFAGDRIALLTWVDAWGGASCVRRTRIVRTSDDRELARAATTWAFVATEGGRPRRIPEDVRRRF